MFLARDPKLDRPVAIKVISERFAGDPDRISRFQREAKILASLNHPNIATIYSLETTADGIWFLVLELVEGETLAHRLSAGPLSVEESLRAGQQISSALEATHRRGVIHRDLKPGNVKLTRDGVPKVLDFGLAREGVPKARDGNGRAEAQAESTSPDPSTTVSMSPVLTQSERARAHRAT